MELTTTNLFKVNPDFIRSILKEKELKAWWVAEQAGIHKTTLRRWLSGKIQRAHGGRVAQLAQVLQVEVGNLTCTE